MEIFVQPLTSTTILSSVKMLAGKTITVDVEPSDTIEKVKQKIWNQASFLIAKETLMFAGKPLEEGSTLSDYNIQNESTIQVHLTGAAMKIFAKTLIGKNITLGVLPNNTILNVKGIFQFQTGVPTAQQKYIYNGEELEDDETVCYYNIMKEATIHVVLRMRGG